MAENEDAIGIKVHAGAPNMKISWSGVAVHLDNNGLDLKNDQSVLIVSNTKAYVSAARLGLNHTWFSTLEKKADNILSLVG